MRAFGISLFATIACALFAGATPIELSGRDNIHVRARETLPEILTGTTHELKVIKTDIDAITFTTVDAVIGVVEDDLESVKTILNDAIRAVDLEAVTDLTVGVTLGDVAELIANVVTLVSGILYTAIKLVGTAEGTIITPIVNDIGSILANFLRLVFKLLPGLLVLVIPLLGSAIQILLKLNLTQVLAILGIFGI